MAGRESLLPIRPRGRLAVHLARPPRASVNRLCGIIQLNELDNRPVRSGLARAGLWRT